MDYLNTVLAFIGRVWAAVWTKIKSVGSMVWDPKPHTILFWLGCWLVICVVTIVAWSMGTSWVNKKLAQTFGLASEVSTLMGKPDATKPHPMPGLVLDPPLTKPLPVPPLSVSEGNHAKVEPVAAPKAEKIRRKKKQKKEATASDPWNF